MQLVISALHTAEQGETAAVFLTGSSGVGKSELLRTAVEQLRQAGATVLVGNCLDIGDITLHPVRHALRRFLAESSQPTSPGAAAAADLVAMLDDQVQRQTSPGEIIERVSAGLRAVSGGQPLVLVIDDLQWVDRTTERLLRYLLAGLDGSRMLLVGAARLETPYGVHPILGMLSELRTQPSVQVLDLAPLSRDATQQLSEAIVGRPLGATAAELIWTRSGGHPYFVEALARSYLDGTPGLPTTLRDIVLVRMARLPPDSLAVVKAVAAGVEPVAHHLLAQVLTLGEEQLIESVRTVVDQRIFDVDDDAYRFHVGVYKEVVESVLLPGERVKLHRRYAEALRVVEATDPRSSRLAHHWRAAGRRREALRAAMAAGERADRSYQFTEAYRCWSIALDILCEAPVGEFADVDFAAVCCAAAEAAHQDGQHKLALEILARANRHAGQPVPCSWHIRQARYLAAAGLPAAAEAEYERAFTAEDCDPRELAVAGAHSAELLVQLGRYRAAGERARTALALARSHDEPSAAVLSSAALGFSQAYLDDPDAGRAVIEEALHAAERSNRPVDIASAYLHLAELLTGPSNDVAAGIAWARAGATTCESFGMARTFGARLLAIAANGLFRIGDWREAEACIDQGLRHGPASAEAAELLLARCRISIGYGHLDAAASDLDAVETLTASANARHMLPLLILRAGLAMWRGDHAEARTAVRRGLELHEHGTEDVVLKVTLLWHGIRAEAEATASGQSVDPQTVDELRRMASEIRHGTVRAAPPVRDVMAGYLALCEAELTRVDGHSDPEAWAAAERLWSARQPYPAAYAALRHAEALYEARTRNASADSVLRRAYGAAYKLRAQPLIEEILQLASRARLRLDPPVVAEPEPPSSEPVDAREGPLAALTAREHEVLELVARGLTNAEIGKKLYISSRTVGVHVSHVLAKLHVRSRVGATAIFQRESPRGDDDR